VIAHAPAAELATARGRPTRTVPASERRRAPVPPELGRLMRPLLPELANEIFAEVQRRIADYGPPSGEVYAAGTRLAVSQAVSYFVDHVVDPTTSRAELDETMRGVGRGEAYEGRSLDSLRVAFRIGAALAWRRIRAFALQQGLTISVLSDLGEALTEFMASLSQQSEAGYREAQAQLSDAAHQWQLRVLDLVLAGRDATPGELASRAAAGNWPVPESVVMVAVGRNPAVPLPSTAVLQPRVLARLHGDRPILLVPGPMSEQLRTELRSLFCEHRIALGCEVPIEDAASSLRWASRALQLAEAGVLPDQPVIDCTQHVGVLWVHAEPLLAELVRRTLLAPLLAEPPHSRRILADTLLAWIEHSRPSAPVLAQILDKHPQTIRYRLKRIRDLFGDALDQPARVQEMHLALQAGPRVS
jgi:hypothetical protein